MKKHISRIIVALMLFSMIFSFAACKSADTEGDNVVMISLIYDPASPYAPVNGGSVVNYGAAGGNSGGSSGASENSNSPAPTASSNSGGTSTTAATTAATTAPQGGSDTSTTAATTAATTAPQGGNDTPAPSSDAPTEAAPAADALPTDNAGILSLYTEMVDTMKAAKPAYRRIEYQTMPEEYRNLGSVANTVLKIAEGMMTSKEKAEQEASVHNKGDDPNNIPIRDNAKGCLLTDASKIKTASCKDNGDGTATLTIELIDESNPKPVAAGATSSEYYTSAMFFPMDQAGIDNIVNKFSAVATMNSLDLVYTECTVTCVFDTATKKVKSLIYVEPVTINVDAKVLLSTITGSARLVDTMEITNIDY